MSKFNFNEGNQNREDLEMESQDNQNIQDNQNTEDLKMESQDNQNIQEKEGLEIDSQDNQNIQDNQEKKGLEIEFSRLIETAENCVSKTQKAIQETLQEIATVQNSIDKPQLECIRNGVLDFDLLGEDIKRIHQQIELDEEAKVLGSYLVILKDIEFNVKVETYLQKQNKTFKQSVQAKVSGFEHIPPDVVNELEANEEVKLFFKLES